MTGRRDIPPVRDLAALAPAVRVAAERVLAGMVGAGWKAMPFDTLRTADRQAFLFGKGRTAEQCLEAGIDAKWAWPLCSDGKVTNAASHLKSWHGFGLAVDIVQADATPWIAPQGFWNALGYHAVANRLTWGGAWRAMLDLPHCQWSRCPTSPTADDRWLYEHKGIEAVWQRYGAA